MVVALLLGAAGCPPPVTIPRTAPCRPRCGSVSVCAQELEARLDEARRPFVACVGDEARLGRLSTAHRCFRALRLLESGRWWLRTLTGEAEAVPTVYGVTREPVRLDFLCRLERLALARSAPAVEERYLEMIRAYP